MARILIRSNHYKTAVIIFAQWMTQLYKLIDVNLLGTDTKEEELETIIGLRTILHNFAEYFNYIPKPEHSDLLDEMTAMYWNRITELTISIGGVS